MCLPNVAKGDRCDACLRFCGLICLGLKGFQISRLNCGVLTVLFWFNSLPRIHDFYRHNINGYQCPQATDNTV